MSFLNKIIFVLQQGILKNGHSKGLLFFNLDQSQLALFLHLIDSKFESHSLAVRGICPPSLCIMQDHTTSLMYSNFLHSLADHIPLMYKDTQAFMTLTAPTTFIFHSGFSLIMLLFTILHVCFPSDSYFRLHIKYLPTLHIWPVKSYHLRLYLNMQHTF